MAGCDWQTTCTTYLSLAATKLCKNAAKTSERTVPFEEIAMSVSGVSSSTLIRYAERPESDAAGSARISATRQGSAVWEFISGTSRFCDVAAVRVTDEFDFVIAERQPHHPSFQPAREGSPVREHFGCRAGLLRRFSRTSRIKPAAVKQRKGTTIIITVAAEAERIRSVS